MILDRAAREAAQHGLAHQLRSIEAIQRTIQGEIRLPLPRRSECSRVSVKQQVITDEQWRHARTIWDYHQTHHDVRGCDMAIGLGSHDLGVARAAVELYHAGWFPLLVFSGHQSHHRCALPPRGEAVHHREHELELGAPGEAILLEPNATNTGQNIALSRQVLADAGIQLGSVLLISKPYMERRACHSAESMARGEDGVRIRAAGAGRLRELTRTMPSSSFAVSTGDPRTFPISDLVKPRRSSLGVVGDAW